MNWRERDTFEAIVERLRAEDPAFGRRPKHASCCGCGRGRGWRPGRRRCRCTSPRGAQLAARIDSGTAGAPFSPLMKRRTIVDFSASLYVGRHDYGSDGS